MMPGNMLAIRCCVAAACLIASAGGASAQTPIWVSAYYSGYSQESSASRRLYPAQIDYGAVTAIVHFALVVNQDGTLDDQTRHVDSASADSLVTAVHAAGRRVLICVGGSSSEQGFRGATSNANRDSFIARLIALDTSRHYDGIDIDWEPLAASDTVQYAAFADELRTALHNTDPQLLLSAATAWQPSLFARVQHDFDQINILTYHLSGPYPGWVTWHNAPIYDGGYTFPGHPTEYLPSANGLVDTFEASGVLPQKIGIGIDFYGAVWRGGDGTPTGGVTAPRQSWTVAPTVTYMAYASIMDSLYQTQYYRWDSVPQAAYLSIDSSGSAGDEFISYDDESSCRAKVNYVRANGIGGVIIWELGAGWRPSAAVPDTLLRTVGEAAFGTTAVAPAPAFSPRAFSLDQNYPNPFNPETDIRYRISNFGPVVLSVYDLLGRRVATLVDEAKQPGEHTVRWNASGFPSGIYYYRLQAGSAIGTKKLVIMK